MGSATTQVVWLRPPGAALRPAHLWVTEGGNGGAAAVDREKVIKWDIKWDISSLLVVVNTVFGFDWFATRSRAAH